jgi:hypothetical protein
MRAALPLAVLALAVAGCGVTPSPQSAVSGAAGTTTSAGSSRLVVSFDGDPTYTGAFEYEHGTGVLDGGVDSPGMIVTERAVYEDMSEWEEGEGDLQIGNKRWLEYPPGDAPLSLFDPFVSAPMDLFDLIEATKNAVRVGLGEERGEAVTRYTATLDVERFIAHFPVDERADVRETFADLWPRALQDGVPLRMALDSQGRLRRLDLTIEDEEEASFELFDYGIDVRATPPPPDQVMTYAEYVKLMEQRMREECEKAGVKLEPGQTHCGACGGEFPTPGSDTSPTEQT